VEISSEDIPGWQVSTEGNLTVALDIHISDELRQEGIARECVNRIQNLRKDSGFDVTDKISIRIKKHELINLSIKNYEQYIKSQTLAESIELVEELNGEAGKEIELDENITTVINISKI
jgi:isoleucyl-tRNA synthetase